MNTGVAISTTGDEHRMKFLETCVTAWSDALPYGDRLFVTVDGDEAAFRRVARVVYERTGSVYRVGQGAPLRDGHSGVAVNKNTGIELLIDNANCTRLWLSDDDVWPRNSQALELHYDLGLPHSLVAWGAHRLLPIQPEDYAAWSWPRGVAMYVEDHVVDALGGMDEKFGPGGHEHVEWSRRIYQAGFTPAPFVSPPEYRQYRGMQARAYWSAEDMPKNGEPMSYFRQRKRKNTSVRTVSADWPRIEQIMASHDGDTSYVPFRAAANGRDAATMSSHNGA